MKASRSATTAPAAERLHSVGRVARETGIQPATLRVWERRYGNPVPLRLASGHRRYAESQLVLLRGVAEGLARGLRPGALLRASPDRLAELLRRDAPRPPRRAREWLELVRSLEPAALVALLQAEERGADPLDFLEGFLAPLLTEIGRAWAAGLLEIRHEHFVSEVVGEHLRVRRRTLREGSAEPYAGSVLLATLAGEQHTLALSMIALLAEEARLEPLLFAADAPLEEIAGALRESGADALAVSVSLAGGGAAADRALARLRELVPAEIPLLAGGAGLPRGRRAPRGIVVLRDLRQLAGWLRPFRDALRARSPGGRRGP